MLLDLLGLLVYGFVLVYLCLFVLLLCLLYCFCGLLDLYLLLDGLFGMVVAVLPC